MNRFDDSMVALTGRLRLYLKKVERRSRKTALVGLCTIGADSVFASHTSPERPFGQPTSSSSFLLTKAFTDRAGDHPRL